MNTQKATQSVYPIFREIVNLIPTDLIKKCAADAKIVARTFSPASHLVALIYQHLTGVESLNGICDAARVHESQWRQLKGAEPPCRNTFSHANRERNPIMMEKLFWSVFAHLKALTPDFARDRMGGYLARFKDRMIAALDSSTIQLTLHCFDWAQHRRRKAAAKLHMNLNVANRLPNFAIVEEASHHDSVRAEATTGNLSAGDILLADRAYVDFSFLCKLALRGVFFVMRQKRNMLMEVDEALPIPGKKINTTKTEILKDEIVHPAIKNTAASYTVNGGRLRRVTAKVEVDGKMMEMMFLTNNLEWSARSIAELYKARWAVELFFKELKQTCQIRDFVGYNENAVKWQIWTALLVHLLLRYLKFLSKWKHSFSRLAGIIRNAIWVRRKVVELLFLYGTASPGKRVILVRKPLYYQAFLPHFSFPMGQQSAVPSVL